MREVVYLGSTLKDLRKMPSKAKGIFAPKKIVSF